MRNGKRRNLWGCGFTDCDRSTREYTYHDGHNEADVKIPEVIAGDTENPADSEAAEQINKSVEEYTDELIAQFEQDMAEEGYKGLNVSYETVMDTASWFTLKVTALETQASGYEVHRFYHIDKKTGKTAALKNLFADGADYITPISDEIKKQMKEQMEAGTGDYFTQEDEYTDGFKAIAENQNFYLDADGNIIIVFDEYEVGPGYIGSPEFTIPAEVISSIRK